MTASTDIRERVHAIIRPLVSAPEFVLDAATLRDDLGCDSLDLIEIVIEIEGAFDIAIDETDETSLVRVGDVVDLVRAKVAERQNGGAA